MKKYFCLIGLFLSSFMMIYAQDNPNLSAMSSQVTELSFLSPADSLTLRAICVLPPTEVPVQGVLQIVHGMCEHKERYLPFMEYMAKAGYVCMLHDHRGHGASVKDSTHLGYFYTGGYSAMIDDVKLITDWIQTEFPNQKIILLGHSMGSMVVRGFAKRYDAVIDGLIVCGSPSYDPNSKLGVKIARHSMKKNEGMNRPKTIQKMSFSAFNKRFKDEGSPNAWICSDTAVVNAYDQDPLCNFQFTSNGFYNLFSLMQYTYDAENWELENPTLPIHFISGADDPCLKNEKKFNQAVDFMKKVGYTQVTSHLYPQMRHEILNEIGKEEVWKDVLQFCQTCLKTQEKE